MKKLVQVVGLGIALTFGGNALADDYDRGHGYSHEYGKGFKGERMMKRMFSRLDLTDEQKEQIHAIRDEAHEQMDAMREASDFDRDAFKAQMKAIMTAETFDEVAYRDLMAEKHARMVEFKVLKAKTKNRIYQVLDEEQRAQAEEMMEKRHERRGKRRWNQ